ncbi:MAG: hypothetical protein Tsb0020_08080 [Haliangiales bacterium]
MRLLLSFTLAALTASCGAGGDSAGSDYAPPAVDAGAGTPECFSSNDCPTGWSCSDFGVCQPPPDSPGDAEPPPPEVEYELGAPVSSLRYVYVAMTDEDALARIDGATLEVSSVRVGEAPRVLATAPDSDAAAVLDAVNGTVTIVRPATSGDQKITLATLPNLNRLSVAPSGEYALAWFDLEKAVQESGGLGGVDRVGSFQDVTVIRLTSGQAQAVDLTVGFRPRAVEFDRDSARAYVITEDGVSVIDLAAATDAGPSIIAPIPVTDDVLADPAAVEVAIVPTGERAVVREAERAELRIVELAGESRGQSQTVTLDAVPSDVDLDPDGSHAYAVLREASALAIVTLPTSAEEAPSVEVIDLGGAPVGSLVLSPDTSRGLLFTNATAAEQLTIIELDEPGRPHRSVTLEKSLRSVHISPDGDHAVLIHAKTPGDPDQAVDFEEFIDRSHGYSVFDIESGFAKLEITPVNPGALAFAPNAPRAYLALSGADSDPDNNDNSDIAALQILELDTGVVRERPLSSPPETVGVLPDAETAFVGQRHPLGRISFIPIAGGPVRTITGFDLNSRIID